MKDNLVIGFIIIFVVYNTITFLVYGYDKRCAIKNKRRVSEKQLITMAFCFGGLGGLLGMQIFRHKTKHLKFQILIPVFLLIQIIISVILAIYV